MAMAQQQAMTQQTMQAAQMARYIPPPSSPIGGGGGYQPMNPYLAGAMNGNMGGMPNPMMMTAPAFGNYRSGGNFSRPHIGQGHIPPIFNPFAPSVQQSHFMTPAMQNLQIMQGVQSRSTGMAAGAVDAGFRFGGAALGALAGSAFGPLGTLAGGFLGHQIGGFLGGMATGPGAMDTARGRQLQNMSAPWMVSGGILNPFTGQGMDREAARSTATGLRHMATRDHDFRRTGFNTEDVMRITQLSSDQGLLTASRSPEDVLRKVKEVSKAVKVLMQITGDPDVRNAIASIGQMKDLGFVGTAGQAGAVANRAMFARMAGVSQGAMNDVYGMPGAMMAQQSGMAGSTGYMAGMAGGAAANIARSSGALDPLQMARAGGVQGLGQINAMAQLSAQNQDIYMAAALKKGKGGIDIDIDAYRKAQTMSISEVSKLAAENMRELQKEGHFELATRKQEFKDKLAQQMTPFEMQMNVVNQARGLQKSVPGMNLGAALRVTAQSNAVGAGMSDDQAEAAGRSMELQLTSREYWDGQLQQRKVQRREVARSEKAKWDQFRTPGLATRMGRGIEGAFNVVSDTLSSPFRSLSNRMDRAAEDEAAMHRGERIVRHGASTLIDDASDRAMARGALKDMRGRGSSREMSFNDGLGERLLNNVGSFFGLSSTSSMALGALKDMRGRGSSREMSFNDGLLNNVGSFFGLSSTSSMALGALKDIHERGSSREMSFNDGLGERLLNNVGSFFGLSSTSSSVRINELAHASRQHMFGNSIGESFGDPQESLRRVMDVVGQAKAMDRGQTLTGTKRSDVMDKLRKSSGVNMEKVVFNAASRIHSLSGTAGTFDSASAMGLSEQKASWIESLKKGGKTTEEAEKFYEAHKDDLHALGAKELMTWGGKDVKERLGRSKDIQTAMGGIRSSTSTSAADKVINEKLAGAGLGALGKDFFSEGHLKATKKLYGKHSDDAIKLATMLSARGEGTEANKVRAMIGINEMMGSMGEEEYSKLKGEADKIVNTADPNALKVLRYGMGAGTDGSLKGISERLGSLKDFSGARMAKTAQVAMLEHIREATGRADVGDSVTDAISHLDADDEDQMRWFTTAQRALLKKAQAGDEDAADEFTLSRTPKSTTETYGGAKGGALKAYDEETAKMAELADQVAVEGGSAANQLLADSSVMLAKASEDLQKTSDNLKTAMNAPAWMSMFGGS